MILDTLANADRYSALHPRFAAAFEFLRRPGLETLQPGRFPIQGDDLFAIVAHANGRRREEAKLECHRKYIDIQFVFGGNDQMGWLPTADCRQPQADYDADKDIRFFDDAPAAWVDTPAGSFCIFFPEDAHAPLVSEQAIRKVVLKVAVGVG
jgi:YhcH/YjgK/YiaL family protein